MAASEFEKKVLESLNEIKEVQKKHTKLLEEHSMMLADHTERLGSINEALQVNSRIVCGAVARSLNKIEVTVDVHPRTNFQRELQHAKEAVCG